jgi:hypothetical protein
MQFGTNPYTLVAIEYENRAHLNAITGQLWTVDNFWMVFLFIR